MPDPAWTMQYQWNQPPEGNGFTRRLIGSPVVVETIGGNPASRNVEITSNNGDCVFLTSQVPALDSTVGVTAEMQVAVNGSGDAGFELTLLDTIIMANVFENEVNLYCPTGDGGASGFNLTETTDSNAADTLFRLLIDGSKRASLYRNGVAVWVNVQCPVLTRSFQRVLWWGEGGGTQKFNILRYYAGGAVIPG